MKYKDYLNDYEKLLIYEWDIIKANNTDLEKYKLTKEDIHKIYSNIEEDLVFILQEGIYKYVEDNFGYSPFSEE